MENGRSMTPNHRDSSGVRLGHSPLGGEVRIHDNFARGSQPILAFGCGLKGFGRGREPFCFPCAAAGQCHGNAAVRVGGYDGPVELFVEHTVAASILSGHANQHPFSDQFPCEGRIEWRAAIVEAGWMMHMNLPQELCEAYIVAPSIRARLEEVSLAWLGLQRSHCGARIVSASIRFGIWEWARRTLGGRAAG